MSRLRRTTARSGAPTATWEDRQIHSRFDPLREARRHLEKHLEGAPQSVIVIGPGLGHLTTAIRERLPRAFIIACHLSEETANAASTHADVTWFPGAEPLEAILDERVSDLAAASMAVVEWPPMVDALPEPAGVVRSTVASFLRRSHASLTTQGAFGRRWMRNRVSNFVTACPLEPQPTERRIRAVVVAGAGPSLEESLPLLHRIRDEIDVWATGSALDALRARGIRPDLVVVTDAAPYALEHVRAVATGGLRVPVASPLSASRGISRSGFFAISEEGTLEAELFGAVSASVVRALPHGTVTATAAAVARSLTAAPLVLAGVDFATLDGRSHARPHLAEVYREHSTTRLSPADGAVFADGIDSTPIDTGWHSTRAHGAYADWFARHANRAYEPLFAICPSPAIAAVAPITIEGVLDLPLEHRSISWRPADWSDTRTRRSICLTVLDAAIREAADAAAPGSIRALDTEQPNMARLAVELALPQLLRWVRGEGWQPVRDAVRAELAAAREMLA